MANIPIRSGGSSPESYSQARKKNIKKVTSSSQIQETGPVYTGATASRISKAQNTIARREQQIVLYEDKLSQIESQLQAELDLYNNKQGVYDTDQYAGRSNYNRILKSRRELHQSKINYLKEEKEKYLKKSRSAQRDISEANKNIERAKQGKTSIKQAEKVKTWQTIKDAQVRNAESNSRMIQPKSLQTQEPQQELATYARPANTFEIKTGIRKNDWSEWQADINGQQVTYSQYREEQVKVIKAAQQANRTSQELAVYGSPFDPNRPVASSAYGGTISKTEASELALQQKAIPVLRKTGPEGNFGLSLSESDRKTITEYQETNLYKQEVAARRPYAVGLLAGSALVVSGGALAVPYLTSAGGALIGAAGLAVPFQATLQKGGELVQSFRFDSETYDFKKQNPEIFEAARQYARQDAASNVGVVSRFFGTEVSFSGGSRFVESGTQYLEAQGFSGSQLVNARNALAAQAANEQAQEWGVLFAAEAVGEGFGGGIISTPIKFITKEGSESTAEFLIRRGAIGGTAEGSFAATSQDLMMSRQINPVNTLIGGGLGGLTAGTFEFLRKGTGTTAKGNALFTTIGNIIEPQEFINDQTLNLIEKATRRSSKKVNLAEMGLQATEIAPNKYRVTSLSSAFTSSTSSSNSYSQSPSRSRPKSFDFSTAASSSSFTRSSSNTRSSSEQNSLVDSNTWTKATSTSNTKNRNLFDSFSRSQQESLSKAQQESLSKSATQSRAFTPSLLALPAQGGSAAFFYGGRRTKRQRKGYSRSIAASLFGNAYKAIGAKSTDVGIVSGLGVRF